MSKVTSTKSTGEGTFEQANKIRLCVFDGTNLVSSNYPNLPEAEVLVCPVCGWIVILLTNPTKHINGEKI